MKNGISQFSESPTWAWLPLDSVLFHRMFMQILCRISCKDHPFYFDVNDQRCAHTDCDRQVQLLSRGFSRFSSLFVFNFSEMSGEISICLTSGWNEVSPGQIAVCEMTTAISWDFREPSYQEKLYISNTTSEKKMIKHDVGEYRVNFLPPFFHYSDGFCGSMLLQRMMDEWVNEVCHSGGCASITW